MIAERFGHCKARAGVFPCRGAAGPFYNECRMPPRKPTNSARVTPSRALNPFVRQLGLADRLIQEFDRGLRTVAAANVSARPFPAEDAAESVTDPAERRHAAGLMRVNHAGEIAAQALYHGQALTARNPVTRNALLAA